MEKLIEINSCSVFLSLLHPSLSPKPTLYASASPPSRADSHCRPATPTHSLERWRLHNPDARHAGSTAGNPQGICFDDGRYAGVGKGTPSPV